MLRRLVRAVLSPRRSSGVGAVHVQRVACEYQCAVNGQLRQRLHYNGFELHVDGRELCELGNVYKSRKWTGAQLGELQRCPEYDRCQQVRHHHSGRTDNHGQSIWRKLQLHRLAHQRERAVDRSQCECIDRDRFELPLDRRSISDVDHDHERRVGIGSRFFQLLGCAKYHVRTANGHNRGGGPDSLDYAGCRQLQLHRDADERLGPIHGQ